MKPCRKAKLAPFFRHLGGEFKSPSFVHGRRVLVDYTHACRVAQAKGGLSCCPKSRGHYIIPGR